VCAALLAKTECGYRAIEDTIGADDNGDLACICDIQTVAAQAPLCREKGESRADDNSVRDNAAHFKLRIRGTKPTRAAGRQKKMRLWALRYRDKEFDLPDVVGSEYLVHLMLNQNQEFRVDELLRKMNGESEQSISKEQEKELLFDEEGQFKDALLWQPDAGHDILDMDEIKRIQGMIKTIEKAIRDGDEAGTPAAVEKWKSKRDDLLSYLLTNTKPGPGGLRLPKRFSKDTFSKQANLMNKHMRGILAHIRVNDREFWSHLNDKAIFRYGETNFYKPTKGILWQISP
jgi:hypothetical protein